MILQQNSNNIIDVIFNDLKNMNLTFNLWNFDFNLLEFLDIKEKYYLKKLIYILKSLLILKQNDDNTNLEKSKNLIILENRKKYLENQIEKLKKNLLEKEEKIKKIIVEKDDKYKNLEKKLKEKEEGFKVEKLKIITQLEIEKNEAHKHKLKFSQLLIQYKNKDYENQLISQKLNRCLNEYCTDDVKTCNENIGNNEEKKIFINSNKNLNNIFDFENFFMHERNKQNFRIKNVLNKYNFIDLYKNSFCFYVNVVLDRKIELEKKYTRIYSNCDSYNFLGNENLKEIEFSSYNEINNNEDNNELDNLSVFNKIILNNNDIYKNISNECFSKHDSKLIEKFNLFKADIKHGEIFLKENTKIDKDNKNSKLKEYSNNIFTMRLQAKNDALEIIDILHNTILELNFYLFSFVLKKIEAKKDLYKKITGNFKQNDNSQTKYEENIKKNFELLIDNKNLIKLYNSDFAKDIKKQILKNFKIFESLYFDVEDLKDLKKNTEEYFFQEYQNNQDNFHTLLFKNNFDEINERIIINCNNKESNNSFKNENEYLQFLSLEKQDDGLVKIKNQEFLEKISQQLPEYNKIIEIINNDMKIRKIKQDKNLKNSYDESKQPKLQKYQNLKNQKKDNIYFSNILDELIKDSRKEKNNTNNGEYINNDNQSIDKYCKINENGMDIFEKYQIENKNNVYLINRKSEIEQSSNSLNNLNSILEYNDFSFNPFKIFELNNIDSRKENSDFSFNNEENYIKEYHKIVLKSPPTKLNEKIFNDFSNITYSFIKTNESFINFFQMYLENEKIDFTKNIHIINLNKKENSINYDRKENELKILEMEETRKKMYINKNLMNLLLNLINSNYKNMREIENNFSKKYLYLDEKLIDIECNINKIKDINKNMEYTLNYFDNYFGIIYNEFEKNN